MAKNQTKSANVDAIEALLAKKESISNAALQSALTKLEERKQKEQEDKLILYLSTVQRNTDAAVNRLRAIRAEEKKAKAYLTALVEAQNAFYTDGNVEAYDKACNEAFAKFRA